MPCRVTLPEGQLIEQKGYKGTWDHLRRGKSQKVVTQKTHQRARLEMEKWVLWTPEPAPSQPSLLRASPQPLPVQ